MRGWVSVTAIVGALGSGGIALGQSNPRYAVLTESKLVPNSQRYSVGYYGMSASGFFVGSVGPRGLNTPSRAFVTDGVRFLLRSPLPGHRNAGAVDMNAFGELAGGSEPDSLNGYFYRHAVFFDGQGNSHDVGTLGGNWSEASALNDSGVVVGESEFLPGTGQFMAFAWQNEVLAALQQPPGGNGISSANGINNDGVIVGFAFNAQGGRPPCRWVDGLYEPLRSLRSDGLPIGGEALAVNDLGQIVGNAGGNGSTQQPVMWERDAITDLDDPLNFNSGYALDINNLTQIVGFAVHYDDPQFGWIWEGGGPGLIRLDSLIPPLSWASITYAYKINDDGAILGHGYKNAGDEDVEFFVMTPVTPAFAMEQIVPGIAGQQNTITVTGLTPGEKVKVYFSDRGGGALIPGCTMTEAALQIESPQFAAAVTADATGVATLTRNIPASYAGKTILLQAADAQNCKVSTLQVQTIN